MRKETVMKEAHKRLMINLKLQLRDSEQAYTFTGKPRTPPKGVVQMRLFAGASRARDVSVNDR